MTNVSSAGASTPPATKPGLDAKSAAEIGTRVPVGESGSGSVGGGGPATPGSGYQQGLGPFVRQFVPAGIIHPGEQSGLRGWMPNGYVHPEDPPGILFNPDNWFHGDPRQPTPGKGGYMPPGPPPDAWYGPGQVGQVPGGYRSLRDCFRQCMQQSCAQLCAPDQRPVPWSPPPSPGCLPGQGPKQGPPTPTTKPGEGPKQTPPTDAPDCPTQGTYTVKPGDTLSKIAAHYGVSWEQVYHANQGEISNPNLIFPGQTFTIPCKDEPSATPKPPVASPPDSPVQQGPPTPPPTPGQHTPRPPVHHTPPPVHHTPKPPHHTPPPKPPVDCPPGTPVQQGPPTPPPVTQTPPTPPPVTQAPPTPPPVKQEPPTPPPVTPEPPVQQTPPTPPPVTQAPPPAEVPPSQVSQSVQQGN